MLNKWALREAAREIIRYPGQVVALTGAGISVESGIPPFRGKGGLWEKYDPLECAEINAFRRNPLRFWELQAELLEVFRQARPNPGHLALARLEEMGYLKTVITQNIDGLHQMAGNTDVVEFHGNSRELVCLSCGQRYSFSIVFSMPLPPLCNCGYVLKPGAVFFGEPIPPEALYRAQEAAEWCRVMLVVGTSAQVYPAANLPYIAKKRGAVIIEVNPEVTELTYSIVDYFLQGEAGKVLPLLVEEVEAQASYQRISESWNFYL